MTQEQATEIIKKYKGENTIILGAEIGAESCAIFWIYKDEEEEDYKIFETSTMS